MLISDDAYEGVELLGRLAAHHAEQPCHRDILAEWIHEPIARTETLLALFCRAGLVVEATGPRHGYHLARPAGEITLAEVFEALGEPRILRDRPLNGASLEPELAGNLEGVDLLWETLRECTLLFLSSISLADIAPGSEPACSDGDGQAHVAPSTKIH